jgi:hypothetical protein
MVFVWLPIYYEYLNSSIWVIWTSVIFSFLQKWLDSFWCIQVFDNHLFTYEILVLVVSDS